MLTGREVSGWIRGLPSAEIEKRVRVLGRLRKRLDELGVSGWGSSAGEPEVDTVLGSFA
jgi:hypothetical protein